MTAGPAVATSVRVLQQLRRDPRTLALLMAVPVVLLSVVRFVINADGPVFDRFGLPLVGIFPMVSMFLVTSIAMLRERTTGTLERLLTMPMAKLDILIGYGAAFALIAAVQAGFVCAVAIGALGLDVAGPLWLVVVLATANAILGMALGLFLSAFATTEFQAVQFMPALLLPQLLLCGIVAARGRMAAPLGYLAAALPMTYAYDGLDAVRAADGVPGEALVDLAVIVGVTILALAAGAATLRRRTA